MIDGEAAIRVSIVGDAEVTAGLDNGGLQGLGVRRTRVEVDVAPIRGRVDDGDLRAELTEHGRTQLGSSTVRAVDRDLHAAQIGANRLDEVRNVGVLRPRVVCIDLTDGVAGGTIPLGVHERLDLVLHRVGQLVAAVPKELDAIVGHRIVRGGDHDAQIHGVLRGRQVRDRGRRNDADASHVHAGARQARREGVVEELARNTGVAANDRAGLGAVRTQGAAELAGSGLAELQREVRSDVNVRQSSHAIRAEHPGHSLSVQWVIRLH